MSAVGRGWGTRSLPSTSPGAGRAPLPTNLYDPRLVDPDQLVSAVTPTIGDLGSAHYFAPATVARGKELGLDGFRFYFLGRGGVLGDVEAPVVASAFGYFAPALVEKMWTSARSKLAPREAARAYLGCGADLARRKLAGADGLEPFCAAAEQVVAAADRAGLALFAGVAAEPLPDDPPARAYQLVNVLRELRGGLHLVAVVATGLSPRVAHLIRRPDMGESFGWAEKPELTEEHRSLLAAADERTDRLCAEPYGALDDAGAAALVAGVDTIKAAFAAA